MKPVLRSGKGHGSHFQLPGRKQKQLNIYFPRNDQNEGRCIDAIDDGGAGRLTPGAGWASSLHALQFRLITQPCTQLWSVHRVTTAGANVVSSVWRRASRGRRWTVVVP